MREQRRLTEWLADYRDSLHPVTAGEAVEARLRAEVRRRKRLSVAPWLLAAGAAAVLALGIWIGRSRPEVAVLATVQNSRPPAPAELAPVTESLAPPLEVSRRATAPRARPAPGETASPRPMAVFVMLPGSELMPPAQDLQILRVRIPRTRMQSLGWPVNVDRLEERVLADVMVGEDGVPRAVRLVQSSQ